MQNLARLKPCQTNKLRSKLSRLSTLPFKKTDVPDFLTSPYKCVSFITKTLYDSFLRTMNAHIVRAAYPQPVAKTNPVSLPSVNGTTAETEKLSQLTWLTGLHIAWFMTKCWTKQMTTFEITLNYIWHSTLGPTGGTHLIQNARACCSSGYKDCWSGTE